MSDTLALCTNANFKAESLDEFAEYKRTLAGDRQGHAPIPLSRLRRWADSEESAARMIRELVAEVDRLRAFER